MSEPTTYRTVADADAYFASQLYATDWTGASDADKAIALLMATRAADSLRYGGVKRAVWLAIVADGTVDTTLTLEQNIANSELTELEYRTADDSQARQFPRNDATDPEAWELTIDATGGTFDLVLNSETAAGIAFDATSATIQTALEALASISSGDVTVTGDGPHVVTMAGDFAAVFYNTLTADASSLTGGAATATIETVEDNVPDEIAFAAFEEARSLLSGRDPEQEFRNLELNSDGVGSNRVTMDRSGVWPEHSAHMITSPLAWKYIQRLLGKNNTFKINRR